MPLNPFENPITHYQDLVEKFQWKCWGESCPACAGGIMPMFIHAHCDCTLRHVGIETETSDPDILGGDLNLFLADKKYHFLLDSSIRIMPFVMLDKLKKFGKPGGTAREAAKRLKRNMDAQHTDWVGTVWSLFPWGHLWKKVVPSKSLRRPADFYFRQPVQQHHKYQSNGYHGLDGIGGVSSLYLRPLVLKAKTPDYTYNDKFNWGR